jgi:hypothetical protein
MSKIFQAFLQIFIANTTEMTRKSQQKLLFKAAPEIMSKPQGRELEHLVNNL